MSDITLIPAGVFVTSLRAFHGDPAIKAHYLDRLRMHAAADEIIKGVYWERGRGCAIGCTIHGTDHGAYERELGIPRLLARIEDRLFERLPNEDAKHFPLQFLEAIPVGADLSQVWPTFIVWLLSDPTYGVRQYAKTDRSRTVIDTIVDLYRCGSVNRAAYAAADAAAAAYAYAAAYAAAYADADAAAAAAAAAYAAADAYVYAAADAAAAAAAAAYADADAYVYAAARRNHRLAQRDMLLTILAACPVPDHA